MSTPIQSLHLQTSMLVYRYIPAHRTLRRIVRKLCLPLVLIRYLYIRRVTGPPPPLKIRTRSQSVSAPSEGKKVKRVTQVKSELLTKLPLEIRQMIWKECLGGKTMHLKLQNRRLMSRCCTNHDTPDPCWEFFGLRDPKKKEKRAEKNQLPSLLLTCHQVYSEAKEYLYSDNVFDSLFFEAVLYLPRVIPSQRLTSIRSLYFLWYLEDPPLQIRESFDHLHYRYDKEVWTMMWENLAKMTGLTSLGVHLCIDPVWHTWWTSEEMKLLQMVKPITSPKKFDLYLPFPTIAKKSELKQLPCTIHRVPSAVNPP